ncbi:MAG: hypothetical protein AAFR89_08965 [Cyanobacteria bacterium J06633_1]
MAAERLIAADRGEEKIAVEINIIISKYFQNHKYISGKSEPSPTANYLDAP